MTLSNFFFYGLPLLSTFLFLNCAYDAGRKDERKERLEELKKIFEEPIDLSRPLGENFIVPKDKNHLGSDSTIIGCPPIEDCFVPFPKHKN